MAIGTTPLFSKISGSVGPVDIRTRRNGKIEIGKKRIPANPQSTRQLEVRAGYGRLHELWQNASYIDKAQYERLGELYHTSAWNAFLMRHQSAMSVAPVASWGMVESSGLDVHDLTTNENHGTISGAVWTTEKPANLSYIYFDGIDDKITLKTSPGFTINKDAGAFSIWFKTSSDFSSNYLSRAFIISKANKWVSYAGITGNGKHKYTIDGETNLNSEWFVQTGHIVDVGKWANVICSFDNGTAKTYLNGNIVDSKAITTNLHITQLGMAVATTAFEGLIGPSAIFAHPITAAQALQIHSTERKLYGLNS